MPDAGTFAIVITHQGQDDRLVELPWLEVVCQIDEFDCVTLSHEGWRAAVDGDAALWTAIAERLLMAFHRRPPQVIAVVGHPSGRSADEPVEAGRAGVRRIVERVSGLRLPTATLGFWTDEDGWLESLIDTARPGSDRPVDREAETEPVA